LGREQTEIDDLAALRPEVLRGIVRDALAPFFDATLAARIEAVARRWRDDANAALEADPRYTGAATLVSAAHNRLEHAAAVLEQAQNEAHASLSEITPPALELPEPEISAAAPEPLFDSNDDWSPAIRRLIEYRRLGDVDDGG
jgi:hypothetical protein